MRFKRIEEGSDADDTDGNAIKFRPEPAIDSADTEGNRFHGAVTDGVEDDTDGNSVKGHVEDGVESDDTEGHRFHGTVTDGVEDDDTGGNIAKAGRAPQTAKPNRDARPLT